MGVSLLQYFPFVKMLTNIALGLILAKVRIHSWVVKIRNISEAVLRPQYTPDRGPTPFSWDTSPERVSGRTRSDVGAGVQTSGRE